MDLEGKVAVVTGASGGLGAEFCKALIDKGLGQVYGLARSTDRLQKLQEALGKQFSPVTLDISRQQSVSQWVEETFSEDAGPDILINNAGVGRFGDVDELPLEDWEAMINTNLSGVFYMTRKIVPLMKQKRTSHIINIASIAGKVGTPTMAGYNASKYGVRGFSEALFKELRYDGIKVTCVNPGSIATKFFGDTGSGSHANMMQTEDMASVLINILETPDNFLINDITMRPLNPKPPEEQ